MTKQVVPPEIMSELVAITLEGMTRDVEPLIFDPTRNDYLMWICGKDIGSKKLIIKVLLKLCLQEDGSLWVEVSYDLKVLKFDYLLSWHRDYHQSAKIAARCFNLGEVGIANWAISQLIAAHFQAVESYQQLTKN